MEIIPKKDFKWGVNNKAVSFKKGLKVFVDESLGNKILSADGYAEKVSVEEKVNNKLSIESNKAIESSPEKKVIESAPENKEKPKKKVVKKKAAKKKES